VWTTDKDGIIMGLLAAELIAGPAAIRAAVYGADRRTRHSYYEAASTCRDAEAEERDQGRDAEQPTEDIGRRARARNSHQGAGQRSSFGGLKSRPTADGSRTAVGPEDVTRSTAESFRDGKHLKQIQGEAQQAVARLF